MKPVNPLISLGCALLMFASAAVNLNDPDPLLWVLMYSLTGVMCLLNTRCILPIPLIRAWSLLLVFCSLMYLPAAADLLLNEGVGSLTDTMTAERPEVEYAREALGLCLAAAFAWFTRPRPKTP